MVLTPYLTNSSSFELTPTTVSIFVPGNEYRLSQVITRLQMHQFKMQESGCKLQLVVPLKLEQINFSNYYNSVKFHVFIADDHQSR